MSAENQAALEAEIVQLLHGEWDPADAAGGAPPDFPAYAHELYSLLARGASDMQIARRIHKAERDEILRPELLDHDQTPLLKALRKIEKRI